MTDINKEANKMDNTYYIVRCDRSGVFAGNIVERNGQEVTMSDARCLWYWDGAASLKQRRQLFAQERNPVCRRKKNHSASSLGWAYNSVPAASASWFYGQYNIQRK